MENQLEDLVKNIPLLQKKIDKIAMEHKVSGQDLLKEMLKFLNLIYLTNEKLSPSYIVDLAWHEFILFTRYYHTFCLKNYQRFIHHTPSENSTKNTYTKTIEFYGKYYQEPPSSIWGEEALRLWEDNNCGACYTN